MANEYLTRTPTSTGNRKVFTWSGWVKRDTTTEGFIFAAGTSNTNRFGFIHNGTGDPSFTVVNTTSSGNTITLVTERHYSDFSSWIHFLIVADTTRTEEENRFRFYINGDEANFASGFQTYPDINEELIYNNLNPHVIGTRGTYSAVNNFTGYLSDVFMIDGQALTPDVFGFYKDGNGYISAGSTQSTDFRPGQWVPKKPSVIKNSINKSGGFGVNGFYLPMNDSSNFGADFHCDPNSIITLQDETAPQPKNGAPTTTDSYVSQLRTDPYAANLVLAVPGISTATGPELVTNGDFSNGTSDWTLGTATGTLSVVDGELFIEYVSTNGAYCTQTITTEVGKSYKVSVTSRTTTSSQPAKFSVGTASNTADLTARIDNNDTTNKIQTASFVATSTTTHLTLGANFTSDAYFDNISVREEAVPVDYSADIKGSGTNKTLTVNGGAGIADIPSYYGSALSFDGTNDYFTTPNSSDFYFNGDFTVEAWIYRNVTNTSESIVGVFENSSARRSWIIETRSNSAIRFQWWSDGSSSSDITSANNSVPGSQWHHVAMVKHNNTMTGYVNGVAVGIDTTAGSIYENTDDPLRIGILNAAEDQDFNGYLQDLRVYKGVAKYKGGFDVPKPYTPVGIGTWRAVSDTTANNFATLNPIEDTGGTITNGNLTFTSDGIRARKTTFATPGNGKWYAEFRTGNVQSGTWEVLGIHPINQTGGPDSAYAANGQFWDGSAWVNFGTAWSNGDIIGIAYNQDDNQISFYLNGTLQGSTQAYSSSESHYFLVRGNTNSIFDCNFGQNPTFSGNTTAGTFTDSNGKGLFKYEPPTGYLAMCEDNLPTPAIADPGDYMRTVLWTGDGNVGRSITGVGFKPDLFWVKERTNTSGHHLFDSVRGAGLNLKSNADDAETSATTQLLSFDNDGFSIGSSGSHNQDGENYVAWCWKAGGAAVSNTDGTITSQVSANQDAGFSIVSYTGSGANATVGHGLGKAPNFIVVKSRTSARDWVVYHSGTGETEYGLLNGTGQFSTASTFWNDTSPTSSVFSVGTALAANASTENLIAYCWAEIEGFSKFGSYTGNANADGPFVYCGFKPAWVMIKRTDDADSWAIFDSSRDPTNPVEGLLRAEGTNVEATMTSLVSNPFGDLLSNGFKIRNASTIDNTGTYIFAAFAESPFQTANAK